jgi:hypothetical protein
MIANMKAVLLARDEVIVAEELWASIVIWEVPVSVRGSRHLYKYRIALIDRDVCVLRYDNEAGKGDHKHMGDVEMEYAFTTLDKLIDDFWVDAAVYGRGRER